MHRAGRHWLTSALQPFAPDDRLLRERRVVAGSELRLQGEAPDKLAERRDKGRRILGGKGGDRKADTGKNHQQNDGSGYRSGPWPPASRLRSGRARMFPGIRHPIPEMRGQRQIAHAGPHRKLAPKAEEQAEQGRGQRRLEAFQLPHLNALLELTPVAGGNGLLEHRAEVDPGAGVRVHSIGG